MTGQMEARRLAQDLAEIDRQLRALERSGQLSGSSIDDGTLLAFDRAGNLRQIIGKQPDGRYTITDHNGPPPPVPAGITAEVLAGGAAITWDGTYAEDYQPDGTYSASTRPADTKYVEVHAAPVPVYLPTDATQVGTFPSKAGGRVVVGLGADVDWYITLVSVSSSYVESAPSAPVKVVPLPAQYSRFFQDTLTVMSSATVHAIPLTYEPIGGSEHVYWNRVYQEQDRWQRIGGAIIVYDDEQRVRPGDLLTVEYAHQGVAAPPVPEDVNVPVSAFDNMVLAVEIGMKGTYTTSSGLSDSSTAHPEWPADLLMDYRSATFATVNGYIGPSGVFLSYVRGPCALVRGKDPIPANAGYQFYFRLKVNDGTVANAWFRDGYNQTASVDASKPVIYDGGYMYLPMTQDGGGEDDARKRVNAFLGDPLGYGAGFNMFVHAAADRTIDPFNLLIAEAWVVAFGPKDATAPVLTDQPLNFRGGVTARADHDGGTSTVSLPLPPNTSASSPPDTIVLLVGASDTMAVTVTDPRLTKVADVMGTGGVWVGRATSLDPVQVTTSGTLWSSMALATYGAVIDFARVVQAYSVTPPPTVPAVPGSGSGAILCMVPVYGTGGSTPSLPVVAGYTEAAQTGLYYEAFIAHTEAGTVPEEPITWAGNTGRVAQVVLGVQGGVA